MQAASDFEPPALVRQYASPLQTPHEEPVVTAPLVDEPHITEKETDMLCKTLDGCEYTFGDPVATKSIEHKLNLMTSEGMISATKDTVEPVIKPLLDKMRNMLEANENFKPYIRKVPELTWSVDSTNTSGKELVFNLGSDRKEDSMFVAARIKMTRRNEGFMLKVAKWYKRMGHHKKRKAIVMCSPTGRRLGADATRRTAQLIGSDLMQGMLGDRVPPTFVRTNSMAIDNCKPCLRQRPQKKGSYKQPEV